MDYAVTTVHVIIEFFSIDHNAFITEFSSLFMTDELWTWQRCGTNILTLKNRLGFSDTICFLDYCIADDGTVSDTLTKKTVKDTELIYWILYCYAEGEEDALTNELVPYDKLPGGYAFFGAFRQLTIDPLLNEFGDNLDGFKKSCNHFNGVQQSFGDISFKIAALPLIPITIVLWEKTEEFPPRCSVFYDKSASTYLPTEALAHVGEILSLRLIDVKRLFHD